MLVGLAKAKARRLDGPSREPEGYKRSSDANNRQNGNDSGCLFVFEMIENNP
jgi:hypothetical protein